MASYAALRSASFGMRLDDVVHEIRPIRRGRLAVRD